MIQIIFYLNRRKLPEKNNIPSQNRGRNTGRRKKLEKATVIEITGAQAKTSTSTMLADILSRQGDVILHTSRGLEYWTSGNCKVIHKGLSITPASILEAVDISISNNFIPDIYIFEVSIGGTGYSDLGILTTTHPDYKIAAGKKQASSAKMQIIENACCKKKRVLCINNAALDTVKCTEISNGSCQEMITFSTTYDQKADANIYLQDNRIIINYLDQHYLTIPVQGGYDPSSYTIAMAAAITASIAMGIESKMIQLCISGFSGISGRMQKYDLDGRTLIDNSNSGMNIVLAEKALRYALGIKIKNIVMLLGEESAQVCEGLDPEDVSKFIKRHGNMIDKLILIGGRMMPVDHKDVIYVLGFEEGLNEASRISDDGDIIVSCVKCFR